MGKASVDSLGVVVTDSEFNITSINHSASLYICGKNLLDEFEGYPFKDKLLQKKSFTKEKIRIYKNSVCYDVMCTAEFGEEFFFVFSGVETSKLGFGSCKNELSDLIMDIKNRLAIVEKGVSVMLENPRKRTDELLKNVKVNAISLLKILSSGSGVVNIENGIVETNKEEFDLVRLVKNVVVGTMNYIKNERINVSFRTREELIIYADYMMIQSAIMNIIIFILNNTNEFCDIDVDVSVSGGDAVIRIINNSAITGNHLANSAFNEDVIDKRYAFSADGIGLAFANGCIKANGGSALFEQVRNAAIFTINIPIEKSKDKLTSGRIHRAPDYDKALFDIREKRIGDSHATNN